MGATNSTQALSTLETSKGSLTGLLQSDAATGEPVCTRYTAIPYALPPVGARRWKRPTSLPDDFTFNKQDGNAGDYTQFGNICPQPVYGHGAVRLPNKSAAPEPENVQSEDCLYLNIWVPAGDAPEGGWPVQFFIHGGWLQVGDAMQNNAHDPFDLLKISPRIIVSPTYRLNLFGFLAGSALSTESPDQAIGNYGFWDQRMALEWTAKNIGLFGGNADNISVGGLSAGAYSTIFQLHYDMRRPKSKDRHIKRIFLYSNTVGIQPNAVDSADAEEQFEELAGNLNVTIDKANPSKALEELRAIPDSQLAAVIPQLKHHTFRAATDNDFISSSFLSSIHDGSFAQTLRERNISILLGEVANEETMYRLVNPAKSYSDLLIQLNNYYPNSVTQALLPHYPLPPQSSRDAAAWKHVGARMIADCQIHATIRGWTNCLKGVNVYRYRISWRAKSLDDWLDPDVGLCHASDTPIWWCSGFRAGYSEEDIDCVKRFIKPFEDFLWGRRVEWVGDGTRKNAPKRPVTAYFDYFHSVRDQIIDEMGPGVEKKDVAAEAVRRWTVMNAAEKARWEDAYIEKMNSYEDQWRDWRINSSSAVRQADKLLLREFGPDGVIRIVEDDFWDRGMEIWEAMRAAQLD